MNSHQGRLALAICCLTFLHATFACHVVAQQQTPRDADEVLRINTELVQTTVTVLDRDGKVVDGLRPEQFELRVNGQVQPVSLFESIVTGSSSESRQLSPGRGEASSDLTANREGEHGRRLVFFVDDRHLSLDGLDRTRQTLLRFLDSEVGPYDKVAIVSTTGQLGYLQQFIENKAVLRAVVGQLKHHSYQAGGFDPGSAPMSEYAALVIERKSDDGVLRFYIRECLKRGGLSVISCEIEVINRARDILRNAAQATSHTYESLDSLVRTLEREPGRKLVVFVSDGFLLDTGPRTFDVKNKLKLITDKAQRAGVVIYTIHARGLNTGMSDATNQVPMDPNGRMESTLLAEAVSSQDPLNALAGDTGGRAFRNRNVFDAAVRTAFQETSKYYLLAWRPANEKQREQKNRNLSVKIIGRPDLTVRVTDALYARSAPAAKPVGNGRVTTDSATNVSQPARSVEPRGLHANLPTAVSVSFLDTPSNSTVVTASVQVNVDDALYGPERKPLAIDIGGVISDRGGKTAASFKTIATVSPLSSSGGVSKVIYNYRAPLPPGIYRVRVAAEDPRSKSAGTATQWIVVPELAKKKLALSSVLVGRSRGRGEHQR